MSTRAPDAAPGLDARFRKSAHVRAGKDFSRCFTEGRRAGTRCFRGAFLAAPLEREQAVARLGMAVSRKVDGRAVERNRLRRLIREWFRHASRQFPPGDLIISGKPEGRGIGATELMRELDLLARRLGLKPADAAGTMPGSSCPSPSGGDS